MIPFPNKTTPEVSKKMMEEVFDKLKTPYKYGAVMKFEDALCDSPTVFFHEGKWYMSFIKIDKVTSTSGYESYLAESEDLLHWHILFPTAKRTENTWDAKQIALYAAFTESDFGGSCRILPINGTYRFSYLGGNLNGYETDPLSMGICKTKNLLDPNAYERSSRPILSPTDGDARPGESKTIYKSYLFTDGKRTLGYPYVALYNGKNGANKESIFLAVSGDGEKWERYGEDPVIFDETPDGSEKINGDPQILRMDDLYVAVFFVLSKGKTRNTFACSYDLIHWKKWTGKALIESEYEWENVYAHKPYIVVKNGVVYHFYCAVNDKKERFIAVATSKEMK